MQWVFKVFFLKVINLELWDLFQLPYSVNLITIDSILIYSRSFILVAHTDIRVVYTDIWNNYFNHHYYKIMRLKLQNSLFTLHIESSLRNNLLAKLAWCTHTYQLLTFNKHSFDPDPTSTALQTKRKNRLF